MKSRFFLVCLIWIVVAVNAFGENMIGKTEVYISSENTEEGYVYLSEEETDIKDIPSWYSNSGFDGISEFWVYAKPNRGYRFEEWRKFNFDDHLFKSFSTEQNRKFTKEGTERFVLMSIFTPITDQGLFGVPAGFSVYVDGLKVEPDDNGDYYIAKGKPVKLTWDDDFNYTFDATMAPGENERFLEFTMPASNLVIPLTSVTIPEGITEIKPFAFRGCEKLTSVSIPNTVESIGKQAFMGCNSLKAITIPKSVTSIGANAFNRNGIEHYGLMWDESHGYNTALEHVYYTGSSWQWNNISFGINAFDTNYTLHFLKTVTFNANGHGGASPAAQTIFAGGKVKEPTALTELGYDFGGWYTDAACTNKFDFNNTLENDLTLYAKWTPNENTISFVTSKDGVEIADQKVLTDQKVTKPETQAVEDEVIEGWYKDKNLTQPYDFNTPVKESMTLYAKWIATNCSATVTGLAMGDDASAITYTLSRDNSGTPEGEKAGSYTITPTGDATQGNYTVTYEPGLLTIAPKKGDVNSDESVDETDIQIVTSVIFSGLYISVADVNEDNAVNVADIVTICDIMNPVFIIDL